MRKTSFGRTGLEISEIAFGGGVTGGILINASEATRWSALQHAVAGGINWIDTAPAYGNGASEAISEISSPVRPKEVFLMKALLLGALLRGAFPERFPRAA